MACLRAALLCTVSLRCAVTLSLPPRSLLCAAARQCAAAGVAAVTLAQASPARALSEADDALWPVLSAAATLDALSVDDPSCAREALLAPPFTDASLPKVGGNVPRYVAPFTDFTPLFSDRLFANNYVRPLPTVGNVLRRQINAFEAGLRFEGPKAGDRDAFEEMAAQRATMTAAASLDYLDLLRNDWLDAVQSLELELDPGDGTGAGALDPPAARAALATARKAARAYLAAAAPNAAPSPVAALCAAAPP